MRKSWRPGQEGGLSIGQFKEFVELLESFFHMHSSVAGHNPYNLFILTIDYSKTFTTR